MYSDKAKEMRRCKATKADGTPCKGWARWGFDMCAAHCIKTRKQYERGYRPTQHAKYEPCHCEAYKWPHRPGSGLCRWPDAAMLRSTTPASTHAWWRPGRLRSSLRRQQFGR